MIAILQDSNCQQLHGWAGLGCLSWAREARDTSRKGSLRVYKGYVWKVRSSYVQFMQNDIDSFLVNASLVQYPEVRTSYVEFMQDHIDSRLVNDRGGLQKPGFCMRRAWKVRSR